jgi:hypothetical protein
MVSPDCAAFLYAVSANLRRENTRMDYCLGLAGDGGQGRSLNRVYSWSFPCGQQKKMKPKNLIWMALIVFILCASEAFLQSFYTSEHSVFYYEISAVDSSKKTCNVATEKENHLSHLIEDAFFTILGGFASGLVGVWLFYRQRRVGAVDSFCIFIEVKKVQIPRGRENWYWSFKDKISDEIRIEGAKMMPFLEHDRRVSFQAAFLDFSNLAMEDLDSDKKTHEAVREKLLAHLDSLIKSVA